MLRQRIAQCCSVGDPIPHCRDAVPPWGAYSWMPGGRDVCTYYVGRDASQPPGFVCFDACVCVLGLGVVGCFHPAQLTALNPTRLLRVHLKAERVSPRLPLPELGRSVCTPCPRLTADLGSPTSNARCDGPRFGVFCLTREERKEEREILPSAVASSASHPQFTGQVPVPVQSHRTFFSPFFLLSVRRCPEQQAASISRRRRCLVNSVWVGHTRNSD